MSSGGNQKVLKLLENYGIVLVLIGIMAFLTWTQPLYFLTAENLSNIIKQNAAPAMLALGMFIVIVTAGIDLSGGAVIDRKSGVRGRG